MSRMSSSRGSCAHGFFDLRKFNEMAKPADHRAARKLPMDLRKLSRSSLSRAAGMRRRAISCFGWRQPTAECSASDSIKRRRRCLWTLSEMSRGREVMPSCENGLLAPHRVGRAESKPHDGTIVTHKVNEMWGTDMTQTITVAEGRAYVFVAVEHANSEVVGIHAARSANRFEALEPVRQGVHGGSS